MKHIFLCLMIMTYYCHNAFAQDSNETVDTDKWTIDSLVLSQMNNLTKVEVPTGLLFNNGFSYNEAFLQYVDPEGTTSLSLHKYNKAINRLKKSFVNKSDTIDSPQAMDNLTYKLSLNKDVPLSLMFYQGNYFDDEYLYNTKELDVLKMKDTSIFAASLLVKKFYNAEVKFTINHSNVFTNIGDFVESFSVNFGDGAGFQFMDLESDNYIANYDCIGDKNIFFRITTNTDTLFSCAKLTIEDMSLPDFTSATGISEIRAKSASIGDMNSLIFGDVSGINYGYFEGDDGVLDRPVFLLEGFELGNSTPTAVFSHWNKVKNGMTSSVIADLTTSGYDVICVSYMQNNISANTNADYVKDFIKVVNNTKVGNKEGILMGESMGGIIGRIALAELEDEGYNAQIRLFVALDSPFKGANIPLGLQTLIYNMANFPDINLFGVIQDAIDDGFEDAVGGDYTLDEVCNALESDAARQLLTYHRYDNLYKYIYKTQSNAIWTSTNEAFLNHLASLGYPTNCRNIALVNGTHLAVDYEFEPNALYYENNEVDEGKWYEPTTRFYTYARMTPLNTTAGEVSHARLKVGGIRYNQKYGYAYYTGSKFFDDCPGSFLDQFSSFGNQGISNFCFVPSVSAIDLNDTKYTPDNGLYYFDTNLRSKDDIINSDASPFDDIISNENNTIHAKIYELEDVAGFIQRELMLDDFYLQNQTISSNKDYQANNSITIGNNVNPYSMKNILSGDVTFEADKDVSITASVVRLKAGTHIKSETVISASMSVTSRSLKLSHNKNNLQLINHYKGAKESYFKLTDKQYKSIKSLPKWTLYGLGVSLKSESKFFRYPEEIKNGIYTLKVEVIDSSGLVLSSTKSIKISDAGSLYNEEGIQYNDSHINIYPNPNNGKFWIKSDDNKSMQISIYDVMGNILYQNNAYNEGFICLPSPYKGLLLVRIKQGETVYNRKILVE